jgi:hypothetical protein
MTEFRPLRVIAEDIRDHWANVYFGAEPYIRAMSQLDTANDKYGHDDARDIVTRFLINASGWRGEDARRIKAELKRIAGTR